MVNTVLIIDLFFPPKIIQFRLFGYPPFFGFHFFQVIHLKSPARYRGSSPSTISEALSLRRVDAHCLQAGFDKVLMPFLRVQKGLQRFIAVLGAGEPKRMDMRMGRIMQPS
jgi:hypothetical protein